MISSDPVPFTVISVPPAYKKTRTPEEIQAELEKAVEARAKAAASRIIPPLEVPTPTIVIPQGLAERIAQAKRDYMERKAEYLASVEDDLPISQAEVQAYQAEYDSYISYLEDHSKVVNEFGEKEEA